MGVLKRWVGVNAFFHAFALGTLAAGVALWSAETSETVVASRVENLLMAAVVAGVPALALAVYRGRTDWSWRHWQWFWTVGAMVWGLYVVFLMGFEFDWEALRAREGEGRFGLLAAVTVAWLGDAVLCWLPERRGRHWRWLGWLHNLGALVVALGLAVWTVAYQGGGVRLVGMVLIGVLVIFWGVWGLDRTVFRRRGDEGLGDGA